MIFTDYEKIAGNALQSLKDLVPIDLGIEFSKAWAIFDPEDKNSNSVVELQTILDLEIKDDSNVVTTVIEKGSFVSYNKVPLPSQIAMTVVLDGWEVEQNASLQKLRALKNSTKKLTVVTPFEQYSDMNLVSLRVSRTVDQGAAQTVAELVLEEIREVNVQTARLGSPAQTKNASAVTNQKIGKIDAGEVVGKAKSAVSGLVDKALGYVGLDA